MPRSSVSLRVSFQVSCRNRPQRELRHCGSCGALTVALFDQAEKEAGVRESDIAAAEILPLRGRQPGLVRAEIQHAAGAARIAVGPALQTVLRADLKSCGCRECK